MAIIAVVTLGALSTASPAAAQSTTAATAPAVLAHEPAHRPRARVYVRPLYPYRHFHSLYPLPYPVEYPGPNAHRECVDGYAVEHRPSGTVITPRMSCRWVAGRYPGP